MGSCEREGGLCSNDGTSAGVLDYSDLYMEGDSDAMALVTEKRAAEVSNRWWRRYLIVYGLFNRMGFHHKATLTKISSPEVAAQENFAIF
ncbi:hypothetical protein SESBI_27899 [Sesbania bispinosa]|nr:hypothetical protein SESBI_27899 [Sesbania bispinosa]